MSLQVQEIYFTKSRNRNHAPDLGKYNVSHLSGKGIRSVIKNCTAPLTILHINQNPDENVVEGTIDTLLEYKRQFLVYFNPFAYNQMPTSNWQAIMDKMEKLSKVHRRTIYYNLPAMMNDEYCTLLDFKQIINDFRSGGYQLVEFMRFLAEEEGESHAPRTLIIKQYTTKPKDKAYDKYKVFNFSHAKYIIAKTSIYKKNRYHIDDCELLTRITKAGNLEELTELINENLLLMLSNRRFITGLLDCIRIFKLKCMKDDGRRKRSIQNHKTRS